MSEDFSVQFAELRPGSMLAEYRLEAQIGAGGMAVVFRARDERLGRRVALKVLAPALTSDAAFRRRFMAESRAAAAVDDPHIIPVYEAGEAGGVLFIAMRFVAGGDLCGVLEREGQLAPARAAAFISPVAAALDAAHGAGLVHRDVKPANILVDAHRDRPEHVYLSDFGVSKGAVSSVSLTGAGHFVGTPDYSAPEQIRGLAVDGRTDQYALACMTYQLLAGVVPFGRDQGMAVLFAHLSEPPPSLADTTARSAARRGSGAGPGAGQSTGEAVWVLPGLRRRPARGARHNAPHSRGGRSGSRSSATSSCLAAAWVPRPGRGRDREGRRIGRSGGSRNPGFRFARSPRTSWRCGDREAACAAERAASPRHGLGAPLGGEASGYSGDHRYVGQDGAGELGPPGPAPVSRRRGGRTSRAPRARRRFSRFGWLVAALVLLVGGGFAGYEYLYQRHVDTPVSSPTATNAPRSPGFDKALGKWQHIGTRSGDPQPLTIAALYPPQFSLNGTSYIRTAASATKTCSVAVFGADLQAALQSGNCTQVVRASYISGDGTMMGTVGVVDLISSNAAQKAGQVTGPQEIIAPLTGKKGPTKKLGTGTGVVQAEIKGHYLILMWAEYANLKSPSGQAQRQALEQFAANLVTGSANIDLSTRMAPGCAAICRTTAVHTLTVVARPKLATPSAIASGSP